jgi:sugar fermentation stimulation protein A
VRFEPSLVRGRLIRRYKRFLADVELDGGEVVTVHCPNSGSMLSVDRPGATVWLSAAIGSRRRLAFSWELIEVGGTLVGINTQRPNAVVAEAIAAGAIPELAGYASIRREVPYGHASRIDLLLEADDRPPCYVEVKNVTLRRGSGADDPVEFPDSRTIRGVKHLLELTGMVRAGARAMMVFLAQRADAHRFAVARDIDPAYAAALAAAADAGVDMVCYRCQMAVDSITVGGRVEMNGIARSSR